MPDGFLLDVNIFRLNTAGDSATTERILAQIDGVALSTITVEEMIVGRLNLINRARSVNAPIRLSEAHEGFAELLEDIAPFRVLTYPAEAEQIYRSFPASIRRVGAQDCRLAAHALVLGFTVITRNLRDFEAIGVPCEDWSAP